MDVLRSTREQIEDKEGRKVKIVIGTGWLTFSVETFCAWCSVEETCALAFSHICYLGKLAFVRFTWFQKQFKFQTMLYQKTSTFLQLEYKFPPFFAGCMFLHCLFRQNCKQKQYFSYCSFLTVFFRLYYL